MVISSQQIASLNSAIRSRFINELLAELKEAGVQSALPLEHSLIAALVRDATGAGIRQESLVYRYCVLALENNVLLKPPMPHWARNILYSNAEPLNKLEALEQYINESSNN
jgi:hypothetical protein